jgi:hypothetical protein
LPEPLPDSRSDTLPTSRWGLIRDAIVFQGKLLVDGLRDAAMMPISLIAAVMDLLGIGDRAGRNFYDVVTFGRHTEHWINLFGAADRLLPENTETGSDTGVDKLVQRMENMVVDEYQRGGITASAKDAVDKALDGLQRPRRR